MDTLVQASSSNALWMPILGQALGTGGDTMTAEALSVPKDLTVQ